MHLTTPSSILLTNVNEPTLFYPQKENITCNQQIFLLEPNLDLIKPIYLYSYLVSNKEKLIRQFHRKQFFNSLTKNKLNDFEIMLPHLEKQKELSEEIIQKERLEKSQKELINLFKKKKNQIINNLL